MTTTTPAGAWVATAAATTTKKKKDRTPIYFIETRIPTIFSGQLMMMTMSHKLKPEYARNRCFKNFKSLCSCTNLLNLATSPGTQARNAVMSVLNKCNLIINKLFLKYALFYYHNRNALIYNITDCNFICKQSVESFTFFTCITTVTHAQNALQF